MRKYITIPDIRQYPSYRSTNARLLYMHMAMGMDIATRTYAHSWRQLAAELCIPLQQVRTALKQLERDGLIATQQVTQRVTYGLTQKVTHKVTQIYILSVSDLDEATNEATNSPTNSQTNSQTNTQSNSDNNNKNISTSGKLTHSDARARLEEIKKWLMGSLGLEATVAADQAEAFIERQALKGKTWDNEGDLLAHAISWAEKRVKAAKAPRISDAEARKAEYQRTAEQEKAKTSQEKEWENVENCYKWWKEAEQRGDQEHAKKMQQYYVYYRKQYEMKYQPNKAS